MCPWPEYLTKTGSKGIIIFGKKLKQNKQKNPHKQKKPQPKPKKHKTKQKQAKKTTQKKTPPKNLPQKPNQTKQTQTPTPPTRSSVGFGVSLHSVCGQNCNCLKRKRREGVEKVRNLGQ